MKIKRNPFFLAILLLGLIFPPNISRVIAAQTIQDEEVIAYHPLTGMVRFVGAQTGTPIVEANALESNITPEKAALSFIALRGNEFGVEDPKNNMKVLLKTQTDIDTNTMRFQQTYQGIPILAGEMIVHMDAEKNVLSASGDILPNIKIDIIPKVSEADAIQSAVAVTAKENGINPQDLQASTPELWIYDPALLTSDDGETVLTWRIEVTPITGLAPIRQLVLVEAKHGGIVLSFNQADHAKNRVTYDASGTSSLPGTLICNESNPTCSGGSIDAVNAHLFAGQTYDFYLTYHGRDSINGAGMPLISTVNYDDDPSDAYVFENAFWNGAQMVYGPGFANADDVVAHELTHGVTDYESKLFYFWQSGAINESFSDTWGEFMDLTNGIGTDTAGVRWQIGEDLTVGIIRNMSNPTIYNDPDKMTSALYYTGNADNGGVHTNSGINNKAVSLMVDGGTFNGQTITALGITKVAKIYYYAQSNLLSSGSDYADLYYALQTSCTAQIGTAGITAGNCQEVLDALNAVEMNLQPVAGYNPDIAACDLAGANPLNSFFDNLETGSANWTSGASVGSNHWTYDWPYTAELGPFAHSGQHFLFADDTPETPTDTYIRMVNSILIPANGKLLFHHAYAMETGYDGGVIEYSTNGGSSWIDAGSFIDGNSYDAVLSSAYSNPLGGRQAFTGLSHGYISTRLNLNSLSGQNVMFRFRMGLDSSVSAFGWWLDDIQIYNCLGSTISGNVGKAGVTLSYTDGTAKTVTSLADGSYALPVSSNWSGTVTPTHACYTFNPTSRTYNNVISSQAGQNYTPTVIPGSGCANVNVTIAGTSMGNYPMVPETSQVLKYLVDGGPVVIGSDNGANIIASLNQWRRNAAQPVGWFTGVAQSMALPVEQITNRYVMPRYNGTNPTLYDAVLMANVDTVPRTITVTIGGTVMGTYPLNPSQSVYATYPIVGGPIVVSSVTGARIVASLYELKRSQAGVPWNGQSEMMGLPSGQLSDKYLLPIYFGAANPATLDARLYFANVDTVATTVEVKIAGVSRGTYLMQPSTSMEVKYLVDGGPVEISSNNGAKIVASLNQWRRNAAEPAEWFTGVAQSMALPVELITDKYVIPRYNGTDPTLYDAVLMANVDTVPRTITVKIGATVMGTYPLNPSASVYATYPIADGPIVVSSDVGAKIVASLYELKRYQAGVPWNGQSEMMGLPFGQLSDQYLLPIYFGAANPATLDARLYIAVP